MSSNHEAIVGRYGFISGLREVVSLYGVGKINYGSSCIIDLVGRCERHIHELDRSNCWEVCWINAIA